MKQNEPIELLAERDKMRLRIIALSKNKESRLNYNALILETQRYKSLTEKLQKLGKKVSIKSNIYNEEYWRQKYRQFNANNINIILPNNNEYVVKLDNKKIYSFTGDENEYNTINNLIKTIGEHLKAQIEIKKA